MSSREDAVLDVAAVRERQYRDGVVPRIDDPVLGNTGLGVVGPLVDQVAVRAIRTHDFLYIRNFESDRWPTGGPDFISSNKAPHGDVDDGPFKDFMLRPETRRDFPLAFELGFGKRPLEELYDCRADPHQLNNLAGDPAYEGVRRELWTKLESALASSGDPRVEGLDPWQGYPYRQVEGFGATFNRTLSESERLAARERGKHAVGHARSTK